MSTIVKRSELEQMTVEQLWDLHAHVSEILSERMEAEKRELERRLEMLGGQKTAQSQNRPRRSHSPVLPRFRNPDDPTQTWSGRGKQPEWIRKQLELGRKLEELTIHPRAIE